MTSFTDDDLKYFKERTTNTEKMRALLASLEAAEELAEALKLTLAALVSYKKYTPEPYKQNPIYIMGSHEAEVAATKALAAYEKVRKL